LCLHQVRSSADEVYICGEVQLPDPQFEFSGERRGGRDGMSPIGISAFASHGWDSWYHLTGRSILPLCCLPQKSPLDCWQQTRHIPSKMVLSAQ
jgi:hypothetical protein